MKKVRIAPSILAWDQGDLRSAAQIAAQGGADQLHLDVIDGHFAPNITFGPGTVKALRSHCDLMFDTHLMIDQPQLFAEKFLDAGSDLLTFHAEVLNAERFDQLASVVRKKGKKIGLAIKPGTELPGWAAERLGDLEALIVMTVNPGFSGQSMDMGVMPKLSRISELVKKSGAGTDIEIDGGVEPDNAGEVVKRGGNVLVAGAGVYSKKDPVAAIATLREKAAATAGGR